MQASQKPPVSPILVLAVGIVAISVAAILVRMAQGQVSEAFGGWQPAEPIAVPSLVIAAWRLTIATVVLLPICLTRYREDLGRLSRRDLGVALLSGVFLAAHFAAWISSLDYTSIAATSVLGATTPLWVAVAAPFLLGERLTRGKQLGIAIALVGSIMIGGGELFSSQRAAQFGSNPPLGNLLALSAAITASAYLMIGRRLRAVVALVPYITLVYGAAAITLMCGAVIGRYELFDYPPAAFMLFALIALVPQLIGHSSFNYALGYLPAAFVTIAAIAEPVGAGVLGMLFFSETPTLITLIGGILILIGIVLVGRNDG